LKELEGWRVGGLENIFSTLLFAPNPEFKKIYSTTPLLHYSTTPLLHYSTTPLLHYILCIA
jgi:hypothetical protein